MKFEVGKKYVTRGGSVVVIDNADTGHYSHPVIGHWEVSGAVYTCEDTGVCWNGTSNLDLVKEYVEPQTVYTLVFRRADESLGLYSTFNENLSQSHKKWLRLQKDWVVLEEFSKQLRV